jgi:hypothetical protein
MDSLAGSTLYDFATFHYKYAPLRDNANHANLLTETRKMPEAQRESMQSAGGPQEFDTL